MENDILYIIREKLPHMSKGHRRIAQYVLEHYEDAAFETAAKIGRITDASESTVVRFAMGLGYDGYPEYQKALVVALRNRLASVKKLDEQYGHNSQAELIRRVMSVDIENLQHTVEGIDPQIFENIVDILNDSENVYIVGLRGGRLLALSLYNSLRFVKKNVIMIENDSEEEVVEQLFRIRENDCLVCISFPKYSERSILSFELACDRKAKTVLITDDTHSPMNMYTENILYARTESVSVVDSLVAPMSLINALSVSVCMRNQEEVGNNISEINSCLMH